jgi:hypothetical protein
LENRDGVLGVQAGGLAEVTEGLCVFTPHLRDACRKSVAASVEGASQNGKQEFGVVQLRIRKLTVGQDAFERT